MATIPLSVVVLTKNEQENICACLESVRGWADEIIVVDDESTDQTVALARDFTDQIYRQAMDNEGQHRNWAYRKAKHEWVLSLDADERVTGALKEEIDAVLPDAVYQAFSMPLKTYIGDYWVRYAGWYPARKIRLFQRKRFRYEEVEVHPRAFVDGQTGLLTGDIIHRGYPDFGHLLASLNRQTTLEAQKWIRTEKPMTRGQMIRRTIDRFFRSYIRKRGIKDGFVGFMIAYFASAYQIMSYAKYWEIKRAGANSTSQEPKHKDKVNSNEGCVS